MTPTEALAIVARLRQGYAGEVTPEAAADAIEALARALADAEEVSAVWRESADLEKYHTARLERQLAEGPKVRALVWLDGVTELYAKSAVGLYRVFERNGFWRAVVHCREDAYFIFETETECAAKSAAEADHRARVLAQLEEAQ